MQRPLSPGFEKVFFLSEPPVPTNFSLVALFTGDPDEIAISRALIGLRERCLTAAVRLDKDERGEVCFNTTEVPDFPLCVVKNTQEGDWHQVVADQLGENFPSAQGPFIRVVLLKRSSNSAKGVPSTAELILTFHHGVADGMSAVFFLRDLLCLLDDPEAQLPKMPPSPELHSVIPERAKRALRTKSLVFVMKTALWSIRHGRRLGLPFRRADRLIDGRPPWQHIYATSRRLTPAQTALLMARCREEGTSVHAALSAAWLRASLQINPARRRRKQVIWSAVNLREDLRAEGAFGVYMSIAFTFVKCDPNRDFWIVARQIKTQLEQDIHTGRVYHWVLTLIGLTDLSLGTLRQALPAFAVTPPLYDISLTNLGRLSLPARGGSLKLEAVYGPAVNSGEGELTVGVSTACDQLTMTLAYRNYILKRVDAEKMADAAVGALGQAVGW